MVALGVAALMACGCADNGRREASADNGAIESSTTSSGPTSTESLDLCAQWDKVSAELAAETLTAREEIAILAGLLPAEYRRDAALFYYPGAGDPGPDADATMAIEAGARLEALRLDACGKPL